MTIETIEESICNDEHPQWRYVWIDSSTEISWETDIERHILNKFPIISN